jgi:DNA-binding transcriptional ArsR family regulator
MGCVGQSKAITAQSAGADIIDKVRHALSCRGSINNGKRIHFDNFRNNLPAGNHFYNSRNMKIEPTDDLSLTLAATSFAALGSEQRLSILRALVRAGPEGLSIGDLGSRTGVTGSTLTHHIKILAQTEMVEQVRKGRSIICAAVAYDQIRHLSEFLLTECCADSTTPCEDR